MVERVGPRIPGQIFGLLFIVALSAFIFVSVLDSAKGGEKFLLKGNAPVLLSLETGDTAKGWTPARLDVQGLVFTFWMDESGRVFEERGGESLLFRLDIGRGQMRNAARILTGEFLEQNSERTRLRFYRLNAALILGIPEGRAALNLKGLVIPVSVLFGPEADGVRELGIGDRRADGQPHLYLDTRKKQLFWESPGYAGRESKRARVSWAVC